MSGHESAHQPGQQAVCTHWDGAQQHHCGTAEGVRLYGPGLRCPAHTPAAVAGRAEPPPGPGMPAGAWTVLSPLGTSALIDARAVASGKCRSSPHAYRAAQAAVYPAAAPTDLHVELGEQDARGHWTRYPAADYRCPRCDWTDSASGDAVPHFAATIRDTHRTTCPNRSTP
ncbi:hypothetical protein ABZ820_34825 [Streptomyces diacarni]|uniref:hypothetical protein n=1 Tax=Streptomyces diacarni TaxID=2800381 RepID=UPI0033C53AC1